jgi:peptidoglycan/LPS O-acetylase OafA/YrhL
MPPRSLLVDGLKVLASQLIVLHHIVLYAPMAGPVAPAWPRLAGLFADEARWVVQVFLAVGGFLAAQALSRRVPGLVRALWQRWLRLVPMLAVALLAVLAASALLPAQRWPDWVTPWPTPRQLLAQLLLLQDVLGVPSLSAGAWYVAIDFQLHALLALGAALLLRPRGRPPWHTLLPWAVAVLVLASALAFNRDPRLDAWAPYFFATYGLGALAAWAPRSRTMAGLFALVCALVLAAAVMDERARLLLGGLCALALATGGSRGRLSGWPGRWLAYWSDASYGVFLIHYAVIVAATAAWLRLGLAGMPAAAALLLLTWAGSLAAGAALQRWVGRRLSAR